MGREARAVSRRCFLYSVTVIAWEVGATGAETVTVTEEMSEMTWVTVVA